jgi:hypothetical protein
MAVSMHRYVAQAFSEDKKLPRDEKTLPPGLTPSTFKTQVDRMLLMFQRHKDLAPSVRETQLFYIPGDQEPLEKTTLSTDFNRFVNDTSRHFFMLQPWDSSSLPFELQKL